MGTERSGGNGGSGSSGDHGYERLWGPLELKGPGVQRKIGGFVGQEGSEGTEMDLGAREALRTLGSEDSGSLGTQWCLGHIGSLGAHGVWTNKKTPYFYTFRVDLITIGKLVWQAVCDKITFFESSEQSRRSSYKEKTRSSLRVFLFLLEQRHKLFS